MDRLAASEDVRPRDAPDRTSSGVPARKAAAAVPAAKAADAGRPASGEAAHNPAARRLADAPSAAPADERLSYRSDPRRHPHRGVPPSEWRDALAVAWAPAEAPSAAAAKWAAEASASSVAVLRYGDAASAGRHALRAAPASARALPRAVARPQWPPQARRRPPSKVPTASRREPQVRVFRTTVFQRPAVRAQVPDGPPRRRAKAAPPRPAATPRPRCRRAGERASPS